MGQTGWGRPLTLWKLHRVSRIGHVFMVGMVVEDVVFDLVREEEPQLAIWTLVNGILLHGTVLSHKRGCEEGPFVPTRRTFGRVGHARGLGPLSCEVWLTHWYEYRSRKDDCPGKS
jgi:hypothetical protein